VQVSGVFFGADLAFHGSEIDLSQMQQENQAAQVEDDLESMVAMASQMHWHLIVQQLWLTQEIQEKVQYWT
jgi:hypothetical protein